MAMNEMDKTKQKKIIANVAGLKVSDVNDKNLKAVLAAKRGAEITATAGQDPAQTDIATLQQRGGAETQYSPEEMTKQEKLGSAILAIAPTLIGAFFGGTKGAAIGANVSTQGLGQIGQNIQARQASQMQARQLAAKESEAERKSQLEMAKEQRLGNQAQAMLGLKRQELAQRAAQGNIEKEPKPNQYQAATFALRVQQAESDLNRISQTYDPTSVGYATQTSGYYPEALKSSEAKQLQQAERNFVNAILRKESGAAISASEFTNAERQYFPRAGDTPEVLAQKAANRQAALAGLMAEAGPAYNRVVEKQQQLSPRQSAVAGKPAIKDRDSKIDFLLGR